MVTTVTLRPPFEYYWWIIVLAVLMLIGALVLLAFVFHKIWSMQRSATGNDKPLIKVPSKRELEIIKRDYTGRLQALSAAYKAKTIDKRGAYHRLSYEIRGFVAETTGINVDNYTKSEIKAVGIVLLDKLLEDYYVPEFGEDERSKSKDFLASCNKALGVVRLWK